MMTQKGEKLFLQTKLDFFPRCCYCFLRKWEVKRVSERGCQTEAGRGKRRAHDALKIEEKNTKSTLARNLFILKRYEIICAWYSTSYLSNINFFPSLIRTFSSSKEENFFFLRLNLTHIPLGQYNFNLMKTKISSCV